MREERFVKETLKDDTFPLKIMGVSSLISTVLTVSEILNALFL